MAIILGNTMKTLIRFDWAMKRLLRSKANYGVLEGFLTALLKEKITIQTILESESNQNDGADKMNRVDLLVENSRGELIFIELQNEREWDFVSRLIYGAAKIITDYIQLGEPFSKIKKVICVSIVYFNLGQGADYIYHGKTRFIGLHYQDELALSQKEQTLYKDKPHVADVYPEYYIIKVNQFDEIAKDSFDEWIYFLKKEEIKANFTAPGLKQAKEVLSVLKLSPVEQKQYRRYLESLSDEASALQSLEIDQQFAKKEAEEQGRAEGKAEKAIDIAKKALDLGMTVEQVAQITGLSVDELKKL